MSIRNEFKKKIKIYKEKFPENRIFKLFNQKLFILILIISILSTIFGIYQNSYSSESEKLQVEITNLEIELTRIESFRDLIINFDLDKSNLAQLFISTAYSNSIEYEKLNSTLTVEEREAKLNLILVDLQIMIINLNETYTKDIQDAFEFKNAITYHYRKEEADGFDYVIKKDNWVENEPGRFITIEEYLNNLNFNSSVAGELFNYSGDDLVKDTLILVINWENVYKLHDQIIIEFQNDINKKILQASNNQRNANTFTSLVSFITIISVLLVAIGNRNAEKKNNKSFAKIETGISQVKERLLE
ncbi:MAG: hypothetical protein HeimC3_32370 [Candidatus Heimdallarchaeota archaeon LC_3]|nr:MAG: hypothetical protein HeimC3_32370 [Candidatus Heimdallarchaeota archaeon LC_3]